MYNIEQLMSDYNIELPSENIVEEIPNDEITLLDWEIEWLNIEIIDKDLFSMFDAHKKNVQQHVNNLQKRTNLLKSKNNALDSQSTQRKWLLLDYKADVNQALVISKNIVTIKPYDESGKNLTWEHSSLRQWLNFNYLHDLPLEMKSRIIYTDVKNEDNGNVIGGNNTTDKIFLLSINEINDFLPLNKDRISLYKGREFGWWLRSPGEESSISDNATTIYSSGRFHFHFINNDEEDLIPEIIDYSNDLNGTFFGLPTFFPSGVRPAFWLQL